MALKCYCGHSCKCLLEEMFGIYLVVGLLGPVINYKRYCHTVLLTLQTCLPMCLPIIAPSHQFLVSTFNFSQFGKCVLTFHFSFNLNCFIINWLEQLFLSAIWLSCFSIACCSPLLIFSYCLSSHSFIIFKK